MKHTRTPLRMVQAGIAGSSLTKTQRHCFTQVNLIQKTNKHKSFDSKVRIQTLFTLAFLFLVVIVSCEAEKTSLVLGPPMWNE